MICVNIDAFFLLWCVAFSAGVGDRFEEECGLEAADSTPLVSGGEGVTANQFPWHVAIFHREEDGQFEQICGGSLVRSNLVISAAHCFSDRAHSHQVNVADYRVVGGIRLNTWDSSEIGRQQSEIREVRLGEEFGSNIRRFVDDVSIVQLMTEFTFSDTVRAVCLDLVDSTLNARQNSPGSVGKVAGWGLTESGAPSDSLKFLSVPVVSRVDCIENLPSNFKSFFTLDKICAGLTKGSAVCQGDSGGGLVFPQNVSTNLQRWYLRGVLSNAPTKNNMRCLTNVFALYTDLYRHKIWLATKMKDILPQGAGCRVRGSAGVCRNITDCSLAREEILLGIMPQLCLLSSPEICCEKPACPPLPPSIVNPKKTGSKAVDYCLTLPEKLLSCQKIGSSWSRGQLCGPEPGQRQLRYSVVPLAKASPSEVERFELLELSLSIAAKRVFIVSEPWLLTTATAMDALLREDGLDVTLPVKSFTITRRVRHPRYLPGNDSDEIDGNNDLELVEMDKPVTFGKSFRPVCLPPPQESVGNLSIYTRYWFSDDSFPVALLPQEECGEVFPPGSIGAADGVTDRHLCVTFNTSSSRGCGTVGYLSASNGHRVACTQLLVGIFLQAEKYGETCKHLFLRVAHYVPWMESVVWP